MIRFRDGNAEWHEYERPDHLIERLRSHDRDFWNGPAGMTSLEFSKGDNESYLDIALMPERSYYMMHVFPDGRTLMPRDRKRAPSTKTIRICGSTIDLAEDRLVETDRAVEILDHFFRTGEPSPEIEWDVP